MRDPISLSTALLDGLIGVEEVGPTNRIIHELSVITDDIALVEAFSHSICVSTEEGLVVFDTSNEGGGSKAVDAIRGWKNDRFNSIIYTHGHVDHVGGCRAFLSESSKRGFERPQIIGHRNVSARFSRYKTTTGYNKIINQRQFGNLTKRGLGSSNQDAWNFSSEQSPDPDIVYDDTLEFSVGGVPINLIHAKGETNDHTWAWLPKQKTICAGDFFIWSFPNAGNPQKAQRYPAEWAAALRSMASMDVEFFLPAHGLPIVGKKRIQETLLEVASLLEQLVSDTLHLMNEGARLNEIIHSVSVDRSLLEKPYLRPIYDEPEFVIRNIWRLYGGWYDGNPANLKPARDKDIASEMALLAGGAYELALRALERVETNIRLSCHLIEMAILAKPNDPRIHELRAEIYRLRRDSELSLMARGIYRSAMKESQDVLDSSC